MRLVCGVVLAGAWLLSCAAQEQEPPHALPDDFVDPYATKTGHPAGAVSVPEPQAGLPTVAPVALESCGNTSEGFDGWLVSFRRHAVEQKISADRVDEALRGVRYDDEVVALDRSQEAHKLSFAEFSRRHVTRERVVRGKELRKEHAAVLLRIEERFGVAPEVLLAIWGLETDYGENMGGRPCLRSLATLAYDCRRSGRFRGELLSALRILDRGDLQPSQMVGAWAGELGQTQFLPSSYERFAIDFDGDGHANLVGSAVDALASTANYLQQHGWRAREAYGPKSPNFQVLEQWNGSAVYRETIVHFAGKLKSTSAPAARRPR